VAPLVLAACGGSSSKPASNSTLRTAVRTTLARGSQRVALRGSLDLAGQKVSVNGDGAFGRRGGTLRLHLDLPGFGRATVDELVVGTGRWIRSPLLASSLHGKTWLRLAGTKVLGIDLGAFAGVTPTTALRVLRLNGKVSSLGTDTLSGISTTHYHLDLDVVRGGAHLTSADAWVDGDDLVRRVKLDLAAATGGGKAQTALTIDYSDFGVAVNVAPPPASEVSA
jgi:hypothetical protein